MKVLFVGLGSIASRHIKNLKVLYRDKVSISIFRSGKGSEMSADVKSMVDKICTDRSELDRKYDCVFVTNPTAVHYDTLVEMQSVSDAFFVEKPVFVTGDEDISLLNDNGRFFYVACPLRYTKVIQYLKQNIDFTKVYAVRSICSSYLPEWRPGMDYRNTYSAHKSMGGGVSIDLIHEWDYLTYLLGFPNFLQCLISKKSHLEIDSDDIAIYLAEYKDKTAELHLDYFGRKSMRQVELFMEDDTIQADLYSAKVCWMRSGKSIHFCEERDDYHKQELVHFFDIINGKVQNDNGLETACKVLRLARGVL